ncbi:MAG: polyphosphate kinase 2 [Bacteroidetes bacterium]|nr:polyphosphate kinase 2 [Bacteroidota bacterium]
MATSSKEKKVTEKGNQKLLLTNNDIKKLKTRDDLISFLTEKNANIDKLNRDIKYEEELRLLQIELLKLQNWIFKNNRRVAIIFEGRDAAGKGGTIRRFKANLNPRSMRVVALTKPTAKEKGQWYFRRYVKELPNPGEVVFFDRSWYNRAVVEPVMGFCSKEEYNTFLSQVPEFEHMIYEDGVDIVKFWFTISKEEQDRRFNSRKTNPLKQWKLSPVDIVAQKKWDVYTHYKEEMFSKTHNSFSPWIIIESNDKKTARLESIRYVLSKFDYDGKESAKTILYPDPNIVKRFHRSMLRTD